MTLKNNIEKTAIPDYSRKQEMFNAISHMLGIVVAVLIGIFGICSYAVSAINVSLLLGDIVFAISAFAVYLVSSVYHITLSDSPYKKRLRILDHCMIYILIAGTYTPVCLNLMFYGRSFGIGLFMLIFEWLGATIGVVLNAFFFQSKIARGISFVFYILMGWLAVLCGGFLFIELTCFLFILIGGIVYTIGSVLYAVGHKNRWFHFVFHIFVLLGTIIQAFGVMIYHY